MKRKESLMLALLWLAPLAGISAADRVDLASLMAEMTNREGVARWPEPPYESLQASSYNRASVHRNQPGWFADSDGTGFIRTEQMGGRTEWVLMEHAGPGCITKMWTPFFYYGFDDRQGPDIHIYLDGAVEPVLSENFIALLTGRGSFRPPLAALTARAGDSYLPIPFAKSCKVTLTSKPFYFIINYRAYPPGTPVASFRREQLQTFSREIETAGKTLTKANDMAAPPTGQKEFALAPGTSAKIELPPGPAAAGWFSVKLAPASSNDASHLRSVVLQMTCDDEPTIWCPVGDFFCCADSLHPFRTWQRLVAGDGAMTCRWPMPYRKSCAISLLNLGHDPVRSELAYGTIPWTWDNRSMYFHAAWRPDELLPGTPFVDWNFVDIRGRGVFVGDAWTVLNPTQGWWGEGDEKIYVDGAWDKGFPTHFGTGTEDYYGWAGGVVPTRQDEFRAPFLANVRVGGVDGDHTRGFNICTRTRALDAIPFSARLCFDMEISPGVEQRRRTDFLGYSAMTFWYARPGAAHNRPPQPDAAARPVMSLADLAAAATRARGQQPSSHGIEFELLQPTAMSPGLSAGPQRPAEIFKPEQWSGEAHFFVESRQPGDFVEFTISEQFRPRTLVLRATTSYDFGIATILVNGRVAVERADLFSEAPTVKEISLGQCEPVENRFVIRCELVAPNPRSRGARTYLGLDSLLIK